MKKSFISRTAAVFIALLMFVLPFAAVREADANADVPSAPALPSFYFKIDSGNIYSGSTVIVTFFCSNGAPETLTSFDGLINFDTSILKFKSSKLFDDMITADPDGKKHQTISLDTTKKDEGRVGFTFSDTNSKVLPSGRTRPFLEIQLTGTNQGGSGSIKGIINSCYSGSKNTETEKNYCTQENNITVTPIDVKVTPTTTIPPSTTTKATTTTTTTTTTTKQTAPLSNENRLSSLTISEGVLTPAFSPDSIAYTAEVPFECSSVRISAVPFDNTVKSVEGFGVKDLQVGSNVFYITCTAQNGSQRQYGIIIMRAAEIGSATVNIGGVTPSDAETTAPPPVETTTFFDFTTTAPSEITSDIAVPVEHSGGGALRVFGIILGEIALFFIGFLSGYFIDKNLKKKEIARLKLSNMILGQNAQRQQAARGGYDYAQYDEQSQYADQTQYPYEQYSSDQYAAGQYDSFGGLSGLTNAAYSDDDSEDYYDQ